MRLYITRTGRCQAIYDETLDVRALGSVRLQRASHVEPDSQGHWTADLGPLGGPRLGPFFPRSQALAAEVAWLETWLTHLYGDLTT
jgi:hypothetical protein